VKEEGMCIPLLPDCEKGFGRLKKRRTEPGKAAIPKTFLEGKLLDYVEGATIYDIGMSNGTRKFKEFVGYSQ